MTGVAYYSMDHLPRDLRDLYDALRKFLLSLGDDVQEVPVPSYVAFRRTHNFALVLGQADSSRLRAAVNVNPATIDLEEGFTRAGPDKHGGADKLRIFLHTVDDLRKAEPLLRQSYEAS